ncbi:MAG TPA: hypothetical protein DGT23_33300, partial [Micromonosporaceae bacterium]|nr:hypothetical protein [Micromonosporaceae bacterium]
MSFPEDVLTAGEKVVLHLRPHWKVMIRPTFVLVVAIAAVVAALALGWSSTVTYIIAGVGLILVAWLSFWPW